MTLIKINKAKFNNKTYNNSKQFKITTKMKKNKKIIRIKIKIKINCNKSNNLFNKINMKKNNNNIFNNNNYNFKRLKSKKMKGNHFISYQISERQMRKHGSKDRNLKTKKNNKKNKKTTNLKKLY